jgi:Protein of unknown function (DUF1173)
MIAVGELKEFKSTTMGYQLVFKHFPDGMFLLEQRTGERAKKIFETELLAWSCGQVKLVAGCLIHAKTAALVSDRRAYVDDDQRTMAAARPCA